MRKPMKVLIVLDDIHLGGISRSLLNYLPHISAEADCDLLIFNYHGLDQSLIPANVRLLKPQDRLHMLGMSQAQIKGYSKMKALMRAGLAILSRVVGGNGARTLLFLGMKKLRGYDLAISFSQDVGWKTISTGCNHFVLDKVEAKYKAAFIHCDYARFGGYDRRQASVYGRFDRVVCVSEACRQSFVGKFPSLDAKTVVCENFTDVEQVRQKAELAPVTYDEAKLNVITVARLGEEKGLLRAAEAVKCLIKKGKTGLCWTVVGDGPQRKTIEAYLDENGLRPYIRLAGGTPNPYVYMKNADLFLLPSYHEAAPMVFGECHALGLPILTTDTISAKELVAERGLGTVCENSTEGILAGLEAALDGEKKPQRLSPDVMRRINGVAEDQMHGFLKSFQDEEKRDRQ